MHGTKVSRREALATFAGAGLALSPALRAFCAEQRAFRISACDWSIGKQGDLAAIALAKEIGLDGVQVSFGPPGEQVDLRKEEVRRQYDEECKRHSVAINSLAMGVLNSTPYASSPDAERWVAECIEVMPKMNQKVVLLAFFSEGDIKDNREAQDEVIRRLKKIAPAAEKADVVLGIESWLDADEHLRILDRVGSPSVQVFYDVANMDAKGYDIYREIRQLGRERICEVHCKENAALLGKGRIDFAKVKQSLDDIGWTGWLVIEGAIDNRLGIVESYRKNQKFLRAVFGA
jgi:sugar phosphate isomerase/epimerase